MASRTRILSALRAAGAPAVPLPALPTHGQRFEDATAQFAQSLASVGGRGERVASMAACRAAVAALPPVLQASRVVHPLQRDVSGVRLRHQRGDP